MIANPGCYASGFISIAYPLVHKNITPSDYPFAITAISGYSGAGKKGIAQYEDSNRNVEFDAPRLYGMGQTHKHLKEMKAIVGLDQEPLFSPYVCDFYSGMIVTVPLFVNKLNKKMTAKEIHEFFSNYYKDSVFVRVAPFTVNVPLFDIKYLAAVVAVVIVNVALLFNVAVFPLLFVITLADDEFDVFSIVTVCALLVPFIVNNVPAFVIVAPANELEIFPPSTEL